MYWSVPPMWRGRTVAVLASGPSMSLAAAESVKHLPRIAVNTTYLLARDADVIYAADGAWWANNPEALGCAGLKVSIELLKGKHPTVPDGVLVMRNTGWEGFDPDPGSLRTLQNSGAQALQIAAHALAAKVLLLGFDMKGGHWHGLHPKPLTNPGPEMMGRWVAMFAGLAHELKAKGVDVVNCSPNSALTCFRKSTVEAES